MIQKPSPNFHLGFSRLSIPSKDNSITCFHIGYNTTDAWASLEMPLGSVKDIYNQCYKTFVHWLNVPIDYLDQSDYHQNHPSLSHPQPINEAPVTPSSIHHVSSLVKTTSNNFDLIFPSNFSSWVTISCLKNNPTEGKHIHVGRRWLSFEFFSFKGICSIFNARSHKNNQVKTKQVLTAEDCGSS